MNDKDSFAALMAESTAQGRTPGARRFKAGDVVTGNVIQIGHDTVFVDVGGPLDARIDRSELVDRSGKLDIAVGDTLTATVISDSPDHGPRLARSLGHGNLDLSQLQQALDSGVPVEGEVTRATKGGLEVTVGGMRAFCPASQVERSFVQDLEPYVGQKLEFRVIEIKDGGRGAVVSRKALLQARAEGERSAVLARLTVGEVLEGSVVSVQKFGAFVDVGGIQGLVHISEIAPHRIERVEDVLEVGEKVQVRVQKIDTSHGQPRLELSMKALQKPVERGETKRHEVLDATVVKSLPNGVLVETAQGSGLVPTRELVMPKGADHRRAFPVGATLRVILLNRDPGGKLSFSAARVGAAEERQNFADYGKGDKAGGATLGSFGDILRAKLGLPETAPTPVAEEPPPQAAPQATAPAQAAPPREAAAPAKAPIAASRVYVDERPPPKPAPKHGLPVGVVRRRGNNR